MVFFRQWLAERNLGLVPIADAAAFDWPGRWLARVRAADSDHAVVMFGSPSGPLFDPADAFRGGTVVEGWLLAPLDLAASDRTALRCRDARRVRGRAARRLERGGTARPDRQGGGTGRPWPRRRPLRHGPRDVQRARTRLPADLDRGGGARHGRSLLGRGTTEHRDSWRRLERSRRPSVPHRLRRVCGATAGGALRSPREAHPAGTAPSPRPPRRSTRRHPGRWHDRVGGRGRSSRLSSRDRPRPAPRLSHSPFDSWQERD